MEARISLRPITADDEPFLYRVYASTREEELKLVNWDEPSKAAFLQMQHHAQHQYYQSEFSDAEYSVIMCDGQPVGRLYVHRRVDEISIIDIALLTEHRRAGIGGSLLRDLLAEADQAMKPIRIHVEYNNPAMHLYKRLGFVQIGETGVYFFMERLPQGMSKQ